MQPRLRVLLATTVLGMSAGGAAIAAPRLAPATQAYLRRLQGGGQQDFIRIGPAIGDLREAVLTEATRRGLRVVIPTVAHEILLDLMKRPETLARVHDQVQNRARDSGYNPGGWLHQIHVEPSAASVEAEAARELAFRTEGLAQRHRPLEELGRWARYHRAVPFSVWQGELIRTLRGLESNGATAEALAMVTKELDGVLPLPVSRPLLDRAAAGDSTAFAQLRRLAGEATAPYQPPTLPPASPAGVASTLRLFTKAHPGYAQLLLDSTVRNVTLGTNTSTVAEIAGKALKDMARNAHSEGRLVEILQLSDGLPLTALRHMAHGVSLPDPNGWRQNDKTIPVRATVVTPRDALTPLIGGDAPPLVESAVEEDLPTALRAERDRDRQVVGRQTAQSVLSRLLTKGQLAIHAGEPVTQLENLARAGKRYDLIVASELASAPDRVRTLAALQRVLRPGGQGYVALDWGASPELDDLVERPDGTRQALVDYLVERHPDAFAVRRGYGQSVLVVRGTAEPVALSHLDASPTGQQVRDGYPQLLWREPASAQ